MILNFRPLDLNTFEANFNSHILTVQKVSNDSGDWKLYVNNKPVRGGIHPSARGCMNQAEVVVGKIVTRQLQELHPTFGRTN